MPAAFAGGQYVNDNPSQGQQRAGAFVAKADDATALYFNPGALTKIQGNEMTFGLSVVQYLVTFDRVGSYPAQGLNPEPNYVGAEYPTVQQSAGPQFVPLVALAHSWGKLAIGYGLFTPHGYPKREFPDLVRAGTGVTAPAPQRYDMLLQGSTVILPSVAAAYEVLPGLSLGARASWGYARLESTRTTWGLPNTSEDPGFDSRFEVAAEDRFVPAFGLGASWIASDHIEVGLVYGSKLQIRSKGTGKAGLGDDLAALMPGGIQPAEPAVCAPGGQPGALSTCIDFDLPQYATAGARYVMRDAAGQEVGDIELDVRWEQWSAGSNFLVTVDGQTALGRLNPTFLRHGFDDVWSARLGGSRRFALEEDTTLELRGGVAHDTPAAPASWTRLDIDGAARTMFAAGIAYEFSNTRVDIGGGYVYQTGRTVVNENVGASPSVDARVQPDPTVASAPADEQPYYPINAGRYDSGYVMGSAGITVAF